MKMQPYLPVSEFTTKPGYILRYSSALRLHFGVPLEKNYEDTSGVPPAFQHIFKVCYLRMKSSGDSVENAIKFGQGTLEERLDLKERLAFGNDLTNIACSPGGLMWVIRHFIGLLPVELLPKRIDNVKYNWMRLSKPCAKYLNEYFTLKVTGNDKDFCYKLTNELLRLPSYNFLLLITLINFFNLLTLLSGGEHTLLVLAKYFAASIFLRPFRPGSVIQSEASYYPLLGYLITKWPDIQMILAETCSNYYYRELFQCATWSGINDGPKEHKDRAIQTSRTLPCAHSYKNSKKYTNQASLNLQDNWSQTEGLDKCIKVIKPITCCCCPWRFHDLINNHAQTDNGDTLHDKYSYEYLNFKRGTYNKAELLKPFAKTEKNEITKNTKEQCDSQDELRENLTKELKVKFSLKNNHLEDNNNENTCTREYEPENDQEIQYRRRFISYLQFLRFGFRLQNRNEIKYEKM